jgi:hypothetical protein
MIGNCGLPGHRRLTGESVSALTAAAQTWFGRVRSKAGRVTARLFVGLLEKEVVTTDHVLSTVTGRANVEIARIRRYLDRRGERPRARQAASCPGPLRASAMASSKLSARP